MRASIDNTNSAAHIWCKYFHDSASGRHAVTEWTGSWQPPERFNFYGLINELLLRCVFVWLLSLYSTLQLSYCTYLEFPRSPTVAFNCSLYRIDSIDSLAFAKCYLPTAMLGLFRYHNAQVGRLSIHVTKVSATLYLNVCNVCGRKRRYIGNSIKKDIAP